MKYHLKHIISEIISCFRKALEAKGVKIDRIILYGSWAKGTQREDSDIDLVVISEDFKEKDFWQRINMLSDAIYEVFVPIEAIAFTPEEWERGDSSVADYAKKKKRCLVNYPSKNSSLLRSLTLFLFIIPLIESQAKTFYESF